MAYTAPYVDSTGLHLPTFQEILDDLVAQAKTIFGQNIYLGNDSADYQLLAIIARKMYDDMQTAQLIYNSRSPITAIGTGLDTVVKLNGLTRKVSSYSTASVLITGTAGTVINHGVCADVSGYLWDLPDSVTIGGDGTVSSTVTCETIGAITASAADINIINTPTLGWTSVTNVYAATPGEEVEQDSELRARQAASVELPSQTMLGGTMAALASLSGADRYSILENPTGSPDTDPNGLGLPGHSITCIVDGGSDAEVAQAIYNNRGIGCYTNGDVEVTIYDDVEMGVLIRFFRPTYVAPYVTVDVHPIGNYTADLLTDIEDSIIAYLNSLQIGEDISVSGVMGAALSVMENLSYPTFTIPSLTIGSTNTSQGVYDVLVGYKESAYGDGSRILVRIA